MTTAEVKRNKSARRIRLCAVKVTQRVQEEVPIEQVFRALGRHFVCDWGDVGLNDWKANDDALECDDRVLSSYKTDGGVTFWIISESDRSSITILFPSEY
jgi:hypothetical protein